LWPGIESQLALGLDGGTLLCSRIGVEGLIQRLIELSLGPAVGLAINLDIDMAIRLAVSQPINFDVGQTVSLGIDLNVSLAVDLNVSLVVDLIALVLDFWDGLLRSLMLC
jgi:hypothetical protein